MRAASLEVTHFSQFMTLFYNCPLTQPLTFAQYFFAIIIGVRLVHSTLSLVELS